MAEKLTAFDPTVHLKSYQAIANFMSSALETNDPAYVSYALGVVTRAKGVTEIVSRTGLSREQSYRSFSAEGNPTLRTTLAVVDVANSNAFERDSDNIAVPPSLGRSWQADRLCEARRQAVRDPP